jgi:monoamine oxidase
VDNKLFFAGEATAVGHIGTVHGAIQSGQRAAAEILT